MRIDGNAIAAEILAEVKEKVSQMSRPPRLVIFSCESTFETKKYLTLKEKRAKEVGIKLQVVECDSDSSTSQVLMAIQAVHEKADGILIQLPFPKRIPFEELETAIAPSHDVDALTYDGSETDILPPVVGAIAAIAAAHKVSFVGKQIVIVGRGRLVGAPSVLYLRNKGAQVTVLTKDSTDIATKTKLADIIILGAGVPGLLQPDMVKDGVIVFDAGTSEMNGALAGDADPAVAEKAALFTPVPGGIGPITIAVLLRNLVRLAKQK